ncbi:MAG: 2-dehydro-3-deoxygalactonokinase [Rhizobiales bacterium]|nr:2-dehydro-3-deoxygalactonokinase [Hyphomicrobiales bacterium]
MADGKLIGIDWGTSTFRAVLMDGSGAVLARTASADGLLSVRDGAFEAVLARAIAPWETGGRLPIIASGMVTSRTGWVETPYLACPAGPADLARALKHLETPAGRHIAFVTGLSFRGPDGEPDVMRGEETQIAGLGSAGLGSAGLGLAGTRLVVMPGTHSKWVHVVDGRILGFRTAMTGDVFAAMKDNTVLKLTTGKSVDAPEAFAAAVRAGAGAAGAGLLGKLFRLRAGSLMGDFPAEETAERLSGLLIGAEIAEGRSFAPDSPTGILIVGGEALAARYAAAFSALGIGSEAAPADAAFAGQFSIARAANLV